MDNMGSPCYVEARVKTSEDPLAVMARLAESGPHHEFVVYENESIWCYAGGILADIRLDRDGATLRGVREAEFAWDGRPLRRVSELLAMLPLPQWRVYGWAAFELSYARDGSRERLDNERLLHLIVPRSEVRLHAGVAHVRSSDPGTLATLVDLLSTRADSAHRRAAPINVRNIGRDEYCASVASAVQEITADVLQKVILSRKIEIDSDIDLAASYVLGRRRNNPARSFLLRLDGLEAAGFSPEIVVSVDVDGTVVSHPLAGTRAFTESAAENTRRRLELLSSAKEIYEHAISVKIGHDELLTVCEPNSVGVRDLMSVEERGSVQHLASQVTGKLAAGADAWDAFTAVFPAVTVSGVPKEAAFAAIRRHEGDRRGLYGGAVLTVDSSGALDAALVLRTVFRENGRTWLRAGAGIVGQSQPAREFEETCEKLDSVARFLVANEIREEVDA